MSVSLSINTSDEPIQEFFKTSSVKQMYISRMCRCLPPIKTEIILMQRLWKHNSKLNDDCDHQNSPLIGVQFITILYERLQLL